MDLQYLADKFEIILDSIADGLFTVDKNFNITFFNKAAEKITKISRSEAVGNPCCEIFKSNICEKDCALRKTIDTGTPISNKTVRIISMDGDKIPISISTAVLKDNNGRLLGGVETFRDLSQLYNLKQQLLDKYTVNDIISKNDKMKKIFSILPNIAESQSTVLLEGHSGTGKELFARAIHNLSNQKEHLFLAVNLSALPENLLESELFGYSKGAFTGANKDKPGRIALAKNGTLFLDEIGEISPAFQVKLLRVIQEKTYEPLGTNKSINANVRFIFATNKNLKTLVQQGHFREDLYYRISVITITLPSLKEKKDDIPILIEHFISYYNKINNKEISGIHNEALSILLNYDYPGNVRELQNIIEHAFILCNDEDFIQINHLPDYLFKGKTISKEKLTLRLAEKNLIIETLKRNNYKKEKTAQELGIDYTTLWRKLNKYGLGKEK